MATAWIVLTEGDLDNYLVAAQAAAVKTAALGAGQTNTFDSVMPDVAKFIRYKISSCATASLSGTANSIPPELKWVGVMLLLEAVQGRIPSLKLSDDQKTRLGRAYSALDRVANCDDEVSTPEDPIVPDVQRASAVEVVRSTRRTRTVDSMRGL